MIRAHVADLYLFASDRIAVQFASGDPDVQPRRLGKVVTDEYQGGILRYEEQPEIPATSVPALSLTEAEGRALLEALAAHFGGSGPAKAARDDLLHERQRNDKLTDALIFVATTRNDARSGNA